MLFGVKHVTYVKTYRGMAINIHPSIQKNHDCDYNDDDLGCTNEGKNRWINQLYMCVDGAFPGLLSRSPYN